MGCSDAGNVEEERREENKGESKTRTNATSIGSKRKIGDEKTRMRSR